LDKKKWENKGGMGETMCGEWVAALKAKNTYQN
jgi:hypothetical protein